MVLTPTIGEKSYNRQDWQKGYQSQPNEYDYEVEDIEGQIPPDLQGTVFKNGPGLLDIAARLASIMGAYIIVIVLLKPRVISRNRKRENPFIAVFSARKNRGEFSAMLLICV
jgi:hypothetical protein